MISSCPSCYSSAAFCLLCSHHVLLFRLVASDCLSCLAVVGHSLSSLLLSLSLSLFLHAARILPSSSVLLFCSQSVLFVVYSIVWLHSYSCPDLLGFCARMRSTCSLPCSCLFPFSPRSLSSCNCKCTSQFPASCVSVFVPRTYTILFFFATRQLLSDIEKLGCGCHTRAPKPISVSCVCRGAEARKKG